MKEVKPEHIKKFINLANNMNKLIQDIRKYNPDANLYVEDCGNFNLMKGKVHDESTQKLEPIHDNVVASVVVYNSGGGGW